MSVIRSPLQNRPGSYRPAVAPGKQTHLLVVLDRTLELAHPGPLVIARFPVREGLGQQVQLHPSVPITGPYVGQRRAELRVPEQRAQVVDGDDHADMVTGLSVAARLVLSLSEVPRKSQMSPVEAPPRVAFSAATTPRVA